MMNIHITDYNGFWAYSMYSFSIWNKAGTADSSTPIQVSIDDSVGNQFNLTPIIDTSTDTTQHRFRIQLNDIGASPYSFPTPAVKIVATLQYTQSR
jgi:hypothetical protein